MTSVETYNGVEAEELVEVAVAVERLSDHPIAEAVAAYGENRLDDIAREASDLESITGRGVRARIAGEEILIGKEELFDESEGPG
ncbi:MAG: heavy metal translocating P-type ATPase, partial [Bradymonadaceae bacterium]